MDRTKRLVFALAVILFLALPFVLHQGTQVEAQSINPAGFNSADWQSVLTPTLSAISRELDLSSFQPYLFLPFAWRSVMTTPRPTETPIFTATPSLTITPGLTKTPLPPTSGEFVVIGWNDLGMHCYNRDFSELAVLPPYNNLWAQVIKRGDPPQIITTGVTVSYSFPDNTYSVGKSNFWTFAPKLFGVTLPDNVGLAGKGLAGQMDAKTDHFVAEGIPLTEYSDSNPNVRDPFQLANLVVKDANGTVLATNQVVAPVSTEMRCDNCHSDGAFGITTGKVETNILTLHDKLSLSKYPAGHTTPLMQNRPVLCAECHSSNALGAPGAAGVASLSNAMHTMHDGKVPNTTDGCYNCHPGPTTKCLRDVMSRDGLGCVDCHGTMAKVKANPNPWLNEPRCENCHDNVHQNNALYRLSTGHGGLYCEACHDSTHAIARSTQPNDAIKFINLQGTAGTLRKCTVCHLTQPTSGGPHN